MLDLINDCLHFVTRYFEIINTSAPHIYHSALALAPQESIIRKLYQPYARPFVRLVYGAPMSWDQDTVTKICPSEITQAVWSPCNRFVAIVCGRGSRGACAYVLDSVTFQQLQTLGFPQDTSQIPLALIFSPDSCILTSFSYHYCRDNSAGELFVISWDLQTGGIASVIRWQSPGMFAVLDGSITYSANGKLVGTLHNDSDTKTLNISICNVASGVYMSSHLLSCGTWFSRNIGTCGESLQFATADTTTITIWDARFTSGGTPIKVETLPTPPNFDSPPCISHVQFLLSSCILALASENKVLVWDAWNSRCLLYCTDTGSNPKISFSSNGHFFAYATSSDVYLWKESPTGYILHKTFQLGPPIDQGFYRLQLLFSWDGESIAMYSDVTIRLWQTNCFTTSVSGISTQTPKSSENFILDFSPDGMLVAVARKNGNAVMVLNPKSGALLLAIDTGTWDVCGLGVTGNTVVVIGDGKVIAWNLPAEGCVPNNRVDPGDSSWIISLKAVPGIFNNSEWGKVLSASISPNSHYVALVMEDLSSSMSDDLCIYSTATGECLGYGSTDKQTAFFTPDGCNIWCTDSGHEAEVWSVGSGQNVLEHLGHTIDVEDPPEGYPWASSYGYEVMDGLWILGPDGKQLLMLPPLWQSYLASRVWKGQFLALLHGGLLEPVILELEP